MDSEPLILIEHNIKRYERCRQLEAGGGGWEDAGTGFSEALGRDIAAHYKDVESYVNDRKGRRKLAAKIRLDSLKEISSILGIVINQKNLDYIYFGFDAIGGIDYFMK